MTGSRSYFYLGGDALHTGLYVDLIERLGAEGLSVGLVPRIRVSPDPVTSWKAWRRRDRLGPNSLERVRERVPAGVHPLPVWNVAPALSVPWLTSIVGPRKADARIVLHTRQVVMARLGLAFRRRRPDVRVIVEVEGDDLAEVEYRRAGAAARSPAGGLSRAAERAYYDRVNRRIVAESDVVICVSRHLKDVLVRRYRVDAERAERMIVMPTFASRAEFFFDPIRRERTRRALGLQNRFVVVYSGNLGGAWQIPDRLVRVFTSMRAARPDAFFLVLTPDGDRIAPHVRAAGIGPQDVRIQACPHHEVPDRLRAADVGLLLRERHPMNEAAAPGKFGEYALSGLPLVMTDGIGDFSRPMRDHPLACVLPDLEDDADVGARVQSFVCRTHGDDERTAFSRWAGERFAIEITAPRLAAIYRTV